MFRCPILIKVDSNFLITLRRCSQQKNNHRINKLLIANRGEIACRIMRSAKTLGIKTVAVFSDADRAALHVRNADEAYYIGRPPSQESYLKMARILDVAKQCGAQAVHPGYGFLSENAEFADLCEKDNIIFVGPPSSAIRDMGLKNTAKSLMSSAGVPVVFGYHGSDQSDAKLKQESERIGYPVMLKAVRGGGGKGMRIAMTAADFDSQLESARREALKSFGNDDMIVEKFVENPRHVEVQVFGDKHGNYVYLFERDCSVQRRHQKIIEEAPAPGISDETRRKLGEAAVKAAAAVKYVGAGTVEFIMDTKQQFFFMEMNTRLQVEHPVTEMITGFDLVEWQLKIAQGERLPVAQNEITRKGHSFETRIYAEDPDNNFMPGAGPLFYLNTDNCPKGDDIRIETGVSEGDEVSVHYDPMIAKLVVWSNDRASALRRLDDVLSGYHVVGLKTNITFLRALANHPEFQRGNVYTEFLRDYGKDIFKPKTDPTHASVCRAVVGLLLKEKLVKASKSADPFNEIDCFRVNLPHRRSVNLEYGGKAYKIMVDYTAPGEFQINYNGKNYCARVTNDKILANPTCDVVEFSMEIEGIVSKTKVVNVDRKIVAYSADEFSEFELVTPKWAKEGADLGLAVGASIAPMPGVIEKVMAKPGQEVHPGDPLLVMVAMKMEYVIKSPKKGIVDKVLCKVGDNVPKNAQLISFVKDKSDKTENGDD